MNKYEYKPKREHIDLKDIKPRNSGLLKALEVATISAIMGLTIGYGGNWVYKQISEITNPKHNSVIENPYQSIRNGNYHLYHIPTQKDLEKIIKKGGQK